MTISRYPRMSHECSMNVFPMNPPWIHHEFPRSRSCESWRRRNASRSRSPLVFRPLGRSFDPWWAPKMAGSCGSCGSCECSFPPSMTILDLTPKMWSSSILREKILDPSGFKRWFISDMSDHFPSLSVQIHQVSLWVSIRISTAVEKNDLLESWECQDLPTTGDVQNIPKPGGL